MNKINELKDGCHGEGIYLINNVTNGVTAKGAKYFNVEVGDDSGSMEAKLWSVTPQDEQLVVKGNIVKISYDISIYNNGLQMRINKVEEVDKTTLDLSQFVQKSPIPLEQLKKEIHDACYSIEDPVYRKLVFEVFHKYNEQFFAHPAASKNHHSYYSGLATHVASMVRLGDSMCQLYPFLCRDLLISGILLHDVGKTIELDGPIAPSYTVEGTLLGHISIMHGILCQIAKEQDLEDKEQTLLLKHLILSHHGQLEFGSPVRPLVPEAEVLNFIDNIDARMMMMEQLMNNTQPGNFSENCFAMEKRKFYKAKSHD